MIIVCTWFFSFLVFLLKFKHKSALLTKLALYTVKLLLPCVQKKFIKSNMGFKCNVSLTLHWNVICDFKGKNSSLYTLPSVVWEMQILPSQYESTSVV